MRELVIGRNDAGQRLDKFLLKTLRGMPMSLLYKDIRTKKIKRNRTRTQPNEILTEGDRIQLFIPDEFFGDAKDTPSYAGVNTKLDILYEDENILLCNKRPGVLCHEDEEGNRNTLIFRICAYLCEKREYDPASEQSFAPALCNRIDRNTGGIVIAAKNAAALRDMNRRIKDGEVRKRYLCAVHGVPRKKEDTQSAYLLKDASSNTVRIYPEEKHPKNAKKIVTGYRVLEEKNGLSLLEVTLYTGRTHQIRAHMEYLGYPLVGEGKYGKNSADAARGYVHQALCSYKVTFDFTPCGDVLDYLAGKTVQIPHSDVYFVGELFGDAPKKERQ